MRDSIMNRLERLLKARGIEDEPIFDDHPVPRRATPSLAQEAVIAALGPGTSEPERHVRWAVATTLLLELAHEGRLEVTGTGEATRARVRDRSRLGDPDLDYALERLIASSSASVLSSIPSLEAAARRITRRLLDQGALVEQKRRRRGVSSASRLQSTPAARRDEVVESLRGALRGESIPDDRTSLLIAAVNLGISPQVLVPKKEVKEASRHAEQIVERLSHDDRALISAVRAAVYRASSDGGGDSSGV